MCGGEALPEPIRGDARQHDPPLDAPKGLLDRDALDPKQEVGSDEGCSEHGQHLAGYEPHAACEDDSGAHLADSILALRRMKDMGRLSEEVGGRGLAARQREVGG